MIIRVWFHTPMGAGPLGRIEIELWLRFWGPWVARTEARAKVWEEHVIFAL